MISPVVVIAYRRADKLRACIDSLRAADGHEQTELYIYADGSKEGSNEEADAGAVAEVRAFLDGLEKEGGFGALHIIRREHNLGLAENVISGISEVIDRHGRVIAVEDDLIVTRDFLTYMNGALDYYENEEDVWSVTGYSDNLVLPPSYDHDIYYAYRACSYGWGTWRDRWEAADWGMERYDEVMRDRTLRRQFRRGGRDLIRMLEDQKLGLIDSWSIRWCLSQSLLGKYTVYPTKSFVVNTGDDGSGTNQQKAGGSRRMTAPLRSRNHLPGVKWQFEHLFPDKRVCRIFYRHYSSLWRRFRRNLNLKGIRRQTARLRSRRMV